MYSCQYHHFILETFPTQLTFHPLFEDLGKFISTLIGVIDVKKKTLGTWRKNILDFFWYDRWYHRSRVSQEISPLSILLLLQQPHKILKSLITALWQLISDPSVQKRREKNPPPKPHLKPKEFPDFFSSSGEFFFILFPLLFNTPLLFLLLFLFFWAVEMSPKWQPFSHSLLMKKNTTE